MSPILRLLKFELLSDRTFAQFGQLLCFAAAIVVYPLAVRKLCNVELSEGHLVIGLLLAGAMALLMVVLGLLLPLCCGRTSRRS